MRWELLLPFAMVPVFWAGVCLIVAKVSGWARLAERYRAESEPTGGARFGWQFLRIGWCDYNGCMTMRVSPEGLHLAVWPVFVGHAALLIPWNQLRLVKESRTRWLAYAQIEVDSSPLTKIFIPLRVLDAGREWLQQDVSFSEQSDLLSVGDAAVDVELPDEFERPIRLSDQWQRHPLILVFVRHSGCTFCRTQAADLRDEYPAIQAAGADVVLVTMDEPNALASLKQQLELPFVCVSDPLQVAYQAYQCPRGSLWAVAGPGMWWRAIKSLLKHGFGRIRGDAMQLPGSFVIDRSGVIQFAYRSKQSADWAPVDDLIQAVKRIA